MSLRRIRLCLITFQLFAGIAAASLCVHASPSIGCPDGAAAVTFSLKPGDDLVSALMTLSNTSSAPVNIALIRSPYDNTSTPAAGPLIPSGQYCLADLLQGIEGESDTLKISYGAKTIDATITLSGSAPNPLLRKFTRSYSTTMSVPDWAEWIIANGAPGVLEVYEPLAVITHMPVTDLSGVTTTLSIEPGESVRQALDDLTIRTRTHWTAECSCFALSRVPPSKRVLDPNKVPNSPVCIQISIAPLNTEAPASH